MAQTYARIFFRNAIATGEVFPCTAAGNKALNKVFKTGDVAELDLDAATITHKKSGRKFSLKPLGAVAPVIEAGGIFAYARKAGMIASEKPKAKAR